MSNCPGTCPAIDGVLVRRIPEWRGEMPLPLKKHGKHGFLICPPSPCPQCGSLGITDYRSGMHYQVVGFPYVCRDPFHRCTRCGSEWYSKSPL